MTNRKDLIKGLEAIGYTLTDARTSKYLTYSRNGDRLYLVGRSGALRTVRQGEPISNSLSLTGNRYHHALCEVGRWRPAFTDPVLATQVVERIMAEAKRNLVANV